MPKSINLGAPLNFKSITLAKSHFDPFRTGGELNQDVPNDQFEQLKVLYNRYCANTGYDLPSPAVAFFPTMEKRSGG
jgi:hypothetical protein